MWPGGGKQARASLSPPRATAVLAMLAGAPAAHADGDTYTDVLNSASQAANNGAIVLADAEATLPAGINPFEPEVFLGSQGIEIQNTLSSVIAGAESLQGTLPAVEQTSPGLLAADQGLLTASTDLLSADKVQRRQGSAPTRYWLLTRVRSRI